MAYNRYGRMKKPIFRLGNPDAGLEIELARCRAMHHVHDAAGILTEAMHYADPACSRSYTSVVEGLSTLERDLTDLEPKAWRSRVACN
jgi:hypothetical protein